MMMTSTHGTMTRVARATHIANASYTRRRLATTTSGLTSHVTGTPVSVPGTPGAAGDAARTRIRRAVLAGAQRPDNTAANRVANGFLRDTHVGMICAGFSGGQGRSGVDLGPQRLVDTGLDQQLRGLGWQVAMVPGFPNPTSPSAQRPAPGTDTVGRLKNVSYVSRAAHTLSTLVRDTCSRGHLPLTLGGDHSLALGTISGSSAVYGSSRLGVVWVDAHADINTPTTTESGNLHGCPLSFLLGLKDSLNVEHFSSWLKPCLAAERLVYIGLRDVDPGERRLIRELGIKAFSMHEVDKYGIGKVMEMALDHLGDVDPIHLSFDVDAMDPTVAPATGTPVRGGLSFREGHYICETMYETGAVVAVDIMEVNPLLAQTEEELIQTVKVGCSLARSALGETLLW